MSALEFDAVDARGGILLGAAGTAAAGKVWTATDANGNGSWQAASAGGSEGAWTALPFAAGWGNYGAGHQAGQYRVVGSTVELRGLVRATAPWGYGSVVANFPVGARPPATTFWPCAISDNVANQAIVRVDAWATGELVIVQSLAGAGQSGATGSWLSLAGIRYGTT